MAGWGEGESVLQFEQVDFLHMVAVQFWDWW